MVKMKKNPLSPLPNFDGFSKEDLDTFIFKFDGLCHSCDYSTDAQKFKLFRETLKDSTLCWFIGLGGNSIWIWANMKKTFLKKYQDYCKV